jgi:hypothetical protein
MEARRAARDWEDAAAITQTVANFRDQASEWWKYSLELAYNSEPQKLVEIRTTWAAFLKVFKAEYFIRKAVRINWHNLASQQQKESVPAYASRVQASVSNYFSAPLQLPQSTIPQVSAAIEERISVYNDAQQEHIATMLRDHAEAVRAEVTDQVTGRASKALASTTSVHLIAGGLRSEKLRAYAAAQLEDPEIAHHVFLEKVKTMAYNPDYQPKNHNSNGYSNGNNNNRRQKVHAVGDAEQDEPEETGVEGVQRKKGQNKTQNQGQRNNQNRDKKKSDNSHKQCTWCGRKYHTESECFKKQRYNSSQVSNDQENTVEATFARSEVYSIECDTVSTKTDFYVYSTESNKNNSNYFGERPFLNISFQSDTNQNSLSNVNLLYDTGASISLITESDFNIANACGAIIEDVTQKCRTNIFNASGDTLHTNGCFKIAFFAHGKKMVGTFFRFPKNAGHSILGMNIINEYNIPVPKIRQRVSELSMDNPSVPLDRDKCNNERVESINSNMSWSVFASKATTISARHSNKVKCYVANQHGEKLRKRVELLAHFPLISCLVNSDENGLFQVFMPNANRTDDIVIEKDTKLGTAEPFSNVTVLNNSEACANIATTTTKPENTPNAAKKKIILEALQTNIRKHVEKKWQKKYFDKLRQHWESFSSSPLDLGRTNIIEHEIHLKDKVPIYTQQFRLPMEQLDYIKDNVAMWLQLGLVERARSPYNSPIFCVPKNCTDENGVQLVRTVLDYRSVNLRTMPDKYSIRSVDECIAEVGMKQSKIFSCADLTSGFWQMLLRAQDRPATAFTIPGQGQFQWCVTAQGLTGAPASFSRLIDTILRDAENTITFIDDVLIHSKNHPEHLTHVSGAITKLSKAGLKLNPWKSIFGARELQYLGHTLTSNGVLPGLDKTKAVRECQPPENVKQLKSFLGLANYFRRYIRDFAVLAQPLFALTRNSSTWSSGELPENALKSFHKIRNRIISRPVLAFVNPKGKFHLYVDAALGDEQNEGGLGAMLMQEQSDGEMKPVGFVSRRLIKHEKNYPAFIAEMAAAVFGMEQFEVYLKGRQFALYTDHLPMCRINHTHQKTLNRLQMKMTEMFPEIRYVDKNNNTVADFLSRYRGMNVAMLDTSPYRLKFLQVADEKLGKIRKALKESADPGKPTIFDATKYKYFINDDGVIMVTPPRRHGFAKAGPKIAVPKAMFDEVIREAHNSIIGGHSGVFKTAERIRSEFWWANMESSINEHIKKCETCQKSSNRYPTRRAPLQPLPQPSGPAQRIHIDLFGGLKTSTKGNNYVMVMTDAFSKLVTLAAIKDKNPKTVAVAFMDNYVHRYGVPKHIHSDMGKEWCNEFIRTLWSLLKIKHTTTTPYFPSGNPNAEVFNRTMAHFLKTAIIDSSKTTLDWEMYIGPLMLSYNSSVHKSTKVSPFYATFGYDPRVPLWETNIKEKEELKLKNESYADHLARHHHTLAKTREIVQENNELARERYTASFNKKNETEECKLKIGDQVWVRVNATLEPNPKLAAKWEKGSIVEQKGPSIFVVRRDGRTKRKFATLNAKHLRIRFVDDHNKQEDHLNGGTEENKNGKDEEEKSQHDIDDEDNLDDYGDVDAIMHADLAIAAISNLQRFVNSRGTELSFQDLLLLIKAGWGVELSPGPNNNNNAVPQPAPQQQQQPQQRGQVLQQRQQQVAPRPTPPPSPPPQPSTSKPSPFTRAQLAASKRFKQLLSKKKSARKAEKEQQQKIREINRLADHNKPGRAQQDLQVEPDDERPTSSRTRSSRAKKTTSPSFF